MGLVMFAKFACHASIHQFNEQDTRKNVHSSPVSYATHQKGVHGAGYVCKIYVSCFNSSAQ